MQTQGGGQGNPRGRGSRGGAAEPKAEEGSWEGPPAGRTRCPQGGPVRLGGAPPTHLQLPVLEPGWAAEAASRFPASWVPLCLAPPHPNTCALPPWAVARPPRKPGGVPGGPASSPPPAQAASQGRRTGHRPCCRPQRRPPTQPGGLPGVPAEGGGVPQGRKPLWEGSRCLRGSEWPEAVEHGVTGRLPPHPPSSPQRGRMGAPSSRAPGQVAPLPTNRRPHQRGPQEWDRAATKTPKPQPGPTAAHRGNQVSSLLSLHLRPGWVGSGR